MLGGKEVAERASVLINGIPGTFGALRLRLRLVMGKGCGAMIGRMRTTLEPTQVVVPPDARQGAGDGRIPAILFPLHTARQPGG